ncbi:MAG: hypothetical protein ACYTG5_08510 [Planctomycetota bacterium]|jgi:hypothetical protein
MSENTTEDLKSQGEADQPVSVIIRPWPKVVFLYPTFICATLFWFIALLTQPGSEGEPAAPAQVEQEAVPGQAPAEAEAEAAEEDSSNLGNIFMIVFFINLLVFSFDFSRIKSITIVVAIIALVLGLGWADSQWEILGNIKSVLGGIDMQMNAQFYGFMSGFLALILLMVLVNTRFNYYEVNHREILHHHGYLGDITRMPTAGIFLNKEIYDLMEYLLLRSGRLIFYAAGKREAVVIDNVINVNRVETRIKDLLSVLAVRVSDQGYE